MATELLFKEEVSLKKPIFVEGLPGVGYIGRNSVGYLIEELKAKNLAEIYSDHFPPIVMLNHKKGGEIIPVKNELYYVRAEEIKKTHNYERDEDIIFLIGDTQSMDSQGHYEVVRTILDILLEKYDLSEIITIGGFGTGQIIEKRKAKVYGATTSEEHAKPFKSLNVEFENIEVGQIIGAAGLFLSEGMKRNIEGVCLMGETSGVLISDPKGTESVLKVLEKYLKLSIDMTKIVEKVKETEKIIKKIESMQQDMLKQKPKTIKDEASLGYIG